MPTLTAREIQTIVSDISSSYSIEYLGPDSLRARAALIDKLTDMGHVSGVLGMADGFCHVADELRTKAQHEEDDDRAWDMVNRQ